MSGSLNKVMIIGFVGRDAEMRYTASGKPRTTFTVAASERWRSTDGEPKERTEWFNVLTWDRLAEICGQYVHKGAEVFVEGRLQSHDFDGQDGQRRRWTEVVASTVEFLDRRPDGVQAPDNDAAFAAHEPATAPDDAPF